MKTKKMIVTKKSILIMTFAIFIVIILGVQLLLKWQPPSYYKYLQKEKAINSNPVVGSFSCGGGYSLQVMREARASKRTIGAVDAQLTVDRKVKLFFANKAIGVNSFKPLLPFSKVYILKETARQINTLVDNYDKSNKYLNAEYTIIQVPSEIVSSDDFVTISDCIKSQYSQINDLLMAFDPDRTKSDGKYYLGGIVLVDEMGQDDGNIYTCNNGQGLDIDGNTVRISKKKWSNVVGVVGLDGILRPASFDNYHQFTILTDKNAPEEFKVLKDTAINKECVDSHGRNFKDVIKSIPEKIEYF